MRHRVDDDHLVARRLGRGDRLDVPLRAEWRAEINDVELVQVVIEIRGTFLGVDDNRSPPHPLCNGEGSPGLTAAAGASEEEPELGC